MLHSLRYSWWIAGVFVVFATINVYVGLSAAAHSQYPSYAEVFDGFMNGPIRLLLPFIVALLAGWHAAAELSHRQIASTRTRTDIRARLAARFGRTLGVVFVCFFLVGMVFWVCAFWLVPALDPHVVDPANYGLRTAAEQLAATVKGAPLAAALHGGTLAFGLTASAWLGLNAATFAAVALVAVYALHKPLVALFVPFGVYLVESVVLQVVNLPGASFLLSAVYPGGLQEYPLMQALLPTVLLAAACACGLAVILLRARTNTRFS